MTHHIHASKAYRVANCPGCLKLERSFQKCNCEERKLGSKYAEEGTRKHELIHDVLEGIIDVETLDNEDRNLISKAKDFAFKKLGGVGVCENSYKVYHPKGDFIAVATADMSKYNPQTNKIYIVDWKFYNGAINQAEVQWQMLVNLTGAMLEFEATEGTAWVYNPIQNQEYEYELKDVRIGVGTITKIWERANTDNPPLNPGSWCKWCDCVDRCPAVQESCKNVLDKTGIRNLQTTTGKAPSQELIKTTLFSELGTWNKDRLREAAKMCAFLKPLDEAIREHIRKDIRKDPDSWPGWSLSTRNDKVSKNKQAVKEFQDKIGYTTKKTEVLNRR